MSDTLIIYEKNNAIISAGFDENKLVSFKIDEKENVYKVGNVFVGHVTKILFHMNAAYVDIGMSKDCYMELVPKMDYLTSDSHPDEDLHVGDELIVQISKEPGRGKPASVTPSISIVGKLVVVNYTGTTSGLSFSSKIKDPEFKKHYTKLFSSRLESKKTVLLRTNALEAKEDEILRDYENCSKTLLTILQNGIHRTKRSLVWESVPNYLIQIRDHKEFDCDKLMTDSPDIYVSVKDYLNEYQPELLPALNFYSDKVLPLENLFDMKKNISEMCSEKVWLKSGGSIVIQQTEAMFVVDVNSSKASGDKKRFKEGFFKINIEAAKEIFRQIRLRGLSGIIIIDFINDKVTPQHVFWEELEKIFAADKSMQLVEITKLGLVEITRKRENVPVFELIRKYGLSGQKNM